MENASDPNVWHEYSEIYIRHGNITNASKILVHVLNGFPKYKDRKLIVWKASLCFKHLNMFDHSLDYSQHLLNEYNNMTNHQREYNIKNNLGTDGSGIPGLSILGTMTHQQVITVQRVDIFKLTFIFFVFFFSYQLSSTIINYHQL